MGRKKNPSIAQPQLYTVSDVAIVLGVCPATVYNLMNREGLPSVKLGSMRRIPPDDLQTWIKQHRSA